MAAGSLRKFAFGLVVLVGGGAMSAMAAESSPDWCEKKWIEESEKLTTDGKSNYTALLGRWQSYASQCRGSVVYEARLAAIYTSLGEHQKAQEILRSVSGKGSKYGYLVDLTYLIDESLQRVENDKVDGPYLDGLEKRYTAFVRKYPSVPEGYAELGNVQTLLGRHGAAIENLEKAKASRYQTWLVYRDLAISYAVTGRYQDSYQASNSALSMKKDLTSDPHFMCAGAIAYAGMGRLDDAKKILSVIAVKKPEVESDPFFKEALQFVRSKLQASMSK